MRKKLLCCGKGLFTLLLFCMLINKAYPNKQKDHPLTIEKESKPVTLQCSACSLEEVLKQLEQEAHVKFFYKQEDVQGIAFRNIHFKETALDKLLTSLLVPHRLTYKVINNRIVIKRKVNVPKGRVEGTVSDGENGEPLTGATVYIRSLGTGKATDVDGKFSMEVPEGTYTLLVSFIGYQSKQITEVNVVNNKPLNLEITLMPDEKQLEEVVVEAAIDVAAAPVKQSTEVTMVEAIKETPGIATGISHQQISRSLDRDAGQVVKRVAGVSLIDRFILIRGLSPRYTPVLVNGLPAPSSESDRRAFSFDLLPSGVIDQVFVHKSPLPYLPSGFAGGVVQVKTKSTNIARHLRLGVSGQFRSGGSSFADYQTYGESSSNDWLAAGVKDRRWKNSSLYDHNFIFPKAEDYPQENRALLEDVNFSNLKQKRYNFDKRFNLEYYDSWRFGNARLNSLTSAFYTQSGRFSRTKYQWRVNYRKAGENNELEKYIEQSYTDSTYTQNVRLGILQNFTLLLNDRHQLSFDNLYNRQGKDQVVNRQGAMSDANIVEKLFELSYAQKVYYQGQLSGTHKLGKLKANWKAGYSQIKEEAPDIERFKFSQAKAHQGDTTDWVLQLSTNPGDFYLRSYAEETEETGYTGTLDLNYSLTPQLNLQMGGWYQTKERRYSLLGYTPLAGANATTMVHAQPWMVMDTVLLGEGMAELYRFRADQYASYQFEDRFYAGYLALEAHLLDKKLTLHGGVRFENNQRDFYDLDGEPIYGIQNLPPPTQNNQFWLPSLSVSYELNRKQMLRASYGKTIDRPDYREQMFFSYYDFDDRVNIQGNPYLKTATIHNLDLRWELYPQEGQFVAVGVFYKKFKNAIETFDRTAASWVGNYISYGNTEKASVYGVEMEFRRSLDFISKNLKDFSVIANMALMKSQANFQDTTWWGAQLDVGLRNDERPMIGASPYVVNAGLYFDKPEWKTQISVLYNLIGPRLRIASGMNNPDQYELSRHILDLVLMQRITKFLSVKIGVQDLLNQPVRLIRDEDLSGDYNPGKPKMIKQRNDAGTILYEDYVESEYKPGSYFSFGINLEF
ncbi:TonB-dependent receptor [Rapidithrix thailandica]|uniref:TonB-dependent receptor n=1 Tax=Rapidithrix thailandica TaxID=413964 RepID=A0AAW9SC18_9BACT